MTATDKVAETNGMLNARLTASPDPAALCTKTTHRPCMYVGGHPAWFRVMLQRSFARSSPEPMSASWNS
jgi:hypothetical protein